MKIKAIKCRPKNHPFPLFAWLIMIFQGWKPWQRWAWSHNALMYTLDNKNWQVIDSTFTGVRIMSERQFCKKYKYLDIVDLEPMDNVIEMDVWIESIKYKKYDFIQLFGLASKFLNLVSFNKIGSNYKKLICAEVILSYVEGRYDLRLGDPDNYDLEMTWDLVRSI